MPVSNEKTPIVRILEIILKQSHFAKEYPGVARRLADELDLDVERTLALVIASQIVNEFGLDPDDETIEFTF
jgi:hypothetical protein